MPGGSAQDEPGAQDNRLTCNPNDPEMEPLKELEDGKKYRITLIATQSGPGDLVPEKVESAEPFTDEAGEPPAEETGAMGAAKDEYDNPAVAGLVAGAKS